MTAIKPAMGQLSRQTGNPKSRIFLSRVFLFNLAGPFGGLSFSWTFHSFSGQFNIAGGSFSHSISQLKFHSFPEFLRNSLSKPHFVDLGESQSVDVLVESVGISSSALGVNALVLCRRIRYWVPPDHEKGRPCWWKTQNTQWRVGTHTAHS